jgi:hypothetical protein
MGSGEYPMTPHASLFEMPDEDPCRRYDDKQKKRAVSEERRRRPPETSGQNREDTSRYRYFEKRGRDMPGPVAGGKRKALLSHAGEGTKRSPHSCRDAAHGSPHDKGIEGNDNQEPQAKDQGYDEICHFGRHAG